MPSCGGEVEVDETFIGGKARNMHKKTINERRITGFWHRMTRQDVMGILDRGGKFGDTLCRESQQRYRYKAMVKKQVQMSEQRCTSDALGGVPRTRTPTTNIRWSITRRSM